MNNLVNSGTLQTSVLSLASVIVFTSTQISSSIANSLDKTLGSRAFLSGIVGPGFLTSRVDSAGSAAEKCRLYQQISKTRNMIPYLAEQFSQNYSPDVSACLADTLSEARITLLDYGMVDGKFYVNVMVEDGLDEQTVLKSLVVRAKLDDVLGLDAIIKIQDQRFLSNFIMTFEGNPDYRKRVALAKGLFIEAYSDDLVTNSPPLK